MADAERDRTKVEAAPESTWGASHDAKAKWQDRFGKQAEKAAAVEAEKEKKD